MNAVGLRTTVCMSTVVSKIPFIPYFLDPGFSQGFHIKSTFMSIYFYLI